MESPHKTQCVCVCVCVCVCARACTTFYCPPSCFPAQKSFSIDLIFLITSHHSKRDHLLLHTSHGYPQYTKETVGITIYSPARLKQKTYSMKCVIHKTAVFNAYANKSDSDKDINDKWTYPNLLINQSVFCILIKLLLRIDVDFIGSQVLSYLHIHTAEKKNPLINV